jgi:hypothetical protein
LEQRLYFAAQRHCRWTTGLEKAAGGQINESRRHTGDADESFTFLFETGYTLKQQL